MIKCPPRITGFKKAFGEISFFLVLMSFLIKPLQFSITIMIFIPLLPNDLMHLKCVTNTFNDEKHCHQMDEAARFKMNDSLVNFVLHHIFLKSALYEIFTRETEVQNGHFYPTSHIIFKRSHPTYLFMLIVSSKIMIS